MSQSLYRGLAPVILFRSDGSRDATEEMTEAAKSFPVIRYRHQAPRGSLVIGRYSELPYRNELIAELGAVGATLVNTERQFAWIANFDWYEALRRWTPESWSERDFHRAPHDGPWVIKGRTNSRKARWNTHCFARTRADAIRVASELAQDELIGQQGLIYRKYEPLVTYEVGINGARYTCEFRFFFWRTALIDWDYYWSTASDGVAEKARADSEGAEVFAREVALEAAKHAVFFVLDVARRESDRAWILIEVNAGGMSGLSEIPPERFYPRLRAAVECESELVLCPQCDRPITPRCPSCVDDDKVD